MSAPEEYRLSFVRLVSFVLDETPPIEQVLLGAAVLAAVLAVVPVIGPIGSLIAASVWVVAVVQLART